MASVDDLCRSYLDLKYHFDPAAASAAGLVSHDSRLGRFDADTVRAHLSALRSVAGAVEELESDDLQAEIDRTALLGEIRGRDLPAGARAAPRAQPGLLAVARLPGALRDARAAERRGWPSARRPRSSGCEPSPRSSTRARDTLDEPPSVFVDTALGMLGGGGELVVQLVAALERGIARAARRSPRGGRRRRSRRSSASAPRSGTRSSPPADPHAFAMGEDQFGRRLHHEHALIAGAPELWRYGLHLQEETEAAAGRAGGKHGCAAVARAGRGAAGRRTRPGRSCCRSTARSWTGRMPSSPSGSW